VRAEDDLSRLLLAYRPGDAVTLGVLRGGERRSLRVKLGERPLDTPRGR
jgi:S1-C subfamily serine protease